MGEDLPQTLNALFTGVTPPPAPIVASTTPSVSAMASAKPTAPSDGTAPTGIKAASEHYTQAMAALKAGDWTQFGVEMQKLGETLGQPDSSSHP